MTFIEIILGGVMGVLLHRSIIGAADIAEIKADLTVLRSQLTLITGVDLVSKRFPSEHVD